MVQNLAPSLRTCLTQGEMQAPILPQAYAGHESALGNGLPSASLTLNRSAKCMQYPIIKPKHQSMHRPQRKYPPRSMRHSKKPRAADLEPHHRCWSAQHVCNLSCEHKCDVPSQHAVTHPRILSPRLQTARPRDLQVCEVWRLIPQHHGF